MSRMYFLLLCLLASIAVSQGSSENTTSDKKINLPKPSIYGISDPYDNPDGPLLHWSLDENSDTPSLWGYKIKLWQVGCDKKPKYKIVDGEQVRLKHVMPRLRDLSTLQNLTEIAVEGATADHVELDIEPDVPYHITVSAVGTGGVGAAGGAGDEGPPSKPLRYQRRLRRGQFTCREI